MIENKAYCSDIFSVLGNIYVALKKHNRDPYDACVRYIIQYNC